MKRPPQHKLRKAFYFNVLRKRRTRDSNPQPLAGHLISSQAEASINPENQADSQPPTAHSTAHSPDLAFIIRRWPKLSDSTKTTLIAVIKALDLSKEVVEE